MAWGILDGFPVQWAQQKVRTANLERRTHRQRDLVALNANPGGNTATFTALTPDTVHTKTLAAGPPGVSAWTVGEVVFDFDTPTTPQAWAKATDAYVGPAEPGPDGTCSVLFWTVWPPDADRYLVVYFTGADAADVTVTYWETRV